MCPGCHQITGNFRLGYLNLAASAKNNEKTNKNVNGTWKAKIS